ncbi:multiprotein-bridging factor 1 family protein [Micromonospora sp. NPDC000121]
MSQTALAEALSYSGALVAKVETCERRPSLDFARRCDAVFGADGRFERIQRRISREAVVPWSATGPASSRRPPRCAGSSRSMCLDFCRPTSMPTPSWPVPGCSQRTRSSGRW